MDKVLNKSLFMRLKNSHKNHTNKLQNNSFQFENKSYAIGNSIPFFIHVFI